MSSFSNLLSELGTFAEENNSETLKSLLEKLELDKELDQIDAETVKLVTTEEGDDDSSEKENHAGDSRNEAAANGQHTSSLMQEFREAVDKFRAHRSKAAIYKLIESYDGTGFEHPGLSEEDSYKQKAEEILAGYEDKIIEVAMLKDEIQEQFELLQRTKKESAELLAADLDEEDDEDRSIYSDDDEEADADLIEEEERLIKQNEELLARIAKLKRENEAIEQKKQEMIGVVACLEPGIPLVELENVDDTKEALRVLRAKTEETNATIQKLEGDRQVCEELRILMQDFGGIGLVGPLKHASATNGGDSLEFTVKLLNHYNVTFALTDRAAGNDGNKCSDMKVAKATFTDSNMRIRGPTLHLATVKRDQDGESVRYAVATGSVQQLPPSVPPLEDLVNLVNDSSTSVYTFPGNVQFVITEARVRLTMMEHRQRALQELAQQHHITQVGELALDDCAGGFGTAEVQDVTCVFFPENDTQADLVTVDLQLACDCPMSPGTASVCGLSGGRIWDDEEDAVAAMEEINARYTSGSASPLEVLKAVQAVYSDRIVQQQQDEDNQEQDGDAAIAS